MKTNTKEVKSGIFEKDGYLFESSNSQEIKNSSNILDDTPGIEERFEEFNASQNQNKDCQKQTQNNSSKQDDILLNKKKKRENEEINGKEKEKEKVKNQEKEKERTQTNTKTKDKKKKTKNISSALKEIILGKENGSVYYESDSVENFSCLYGVGPFEDKNYFDDLCGGSPLDYDFQKEKESNLGEDSEAELETEKSKSSKFNPSNLCPLNSNVQKYEQNSGKLVPEDFKTVVPNHNFDLSENEIESQNENGNGNVFFSSMNDNSTFYDELLGDFSERKIYDG